MKKFNKNYNHTFALNSVGQIYNLFGRFIHIL